MSRRGRRGKEGRRKRQTCRCAQVDEGSAVSSRVDARRRDVAHVHLASATVAPDVVSKRDCCRLAELQWHAMRAGGVSRAGCGGKDGSAGTLEAGRVIIVLATMSMLRAGSREGVGGFAPNACEMPRYLARAVGAGAGEEGGGGLSIVGSVRSAAMAASGRSGVQSGRSGAGIQVLKTARSHGRSVVYTQREEWSTFQVLSPELGDPGQDACDWGALRNAQTGTGRISTDSTPPVV